MLQVAAGDTELATPRLRLRPPVDGDAERIAALVTPEVARWTATWPSPCSRAVACERIGRMRASLAAGRALPLAIEERAVPGLIGLVSAVVVKDDPGRVSVGFWLGEPWHRRGYMTEAVGAVLRRLARDPDVRVIDAGAQLANAASIGVMARLGMRPVGTRMAPAPVRGRDEECIFYEIAPHEVR